MPRVAGVNVPDNKKIEIALTSIYGIGRSLALKILHQTDVKLHKKASELTQEEVKRLKNFIEKNLKIEGAMRRGISQDIKRLKDIRCWRGERHIRGLPVRGQTTRVNSRTVRGNVRRTMGSGRKQAPTPK